MTATATESIRKALNSGRPGVQATALEKIKVGDMLKPIDETITIASGTTINLGTQSAALRKAMMIQSVRVVTGTATGARQVGDAGSTPSTTLVKYDPVTGILTFEAAITVARIVWLAAADTDVDTVYAPTT